MERPCLSRSRRTLIYTRDGHVSVQLMYPASANSLSNEYVLNGYEASFGSYDVDETTRMVTHHVQGSITRDLLVGKDLPPLEPCMMASFLGFRSASFFKFDAVSGV